MMMFLLRMVFWLGLVCVLLPASGEKKQASQMPQIDTLQAMSAAGAAYSDMRGFCDRQAQACVVGGQVASALGQRAQDGARTIVEFIGQQMSDSGSHKTPHAVTSHKTAHAVASQNTLTAADAAPAWNNPAAPASVPLPPVPPRREAQTRRPAA